MDHGRLHILVVDDLADAADSTVELLSLWGYDAAACYNGGAALKSAGARRPDAVILDLAMPLMDGFRCARELRRVVGCEEVPVIALSGYSGAEYYARAREVGINYYLLKTSDPDRLRELLAWEIMPAALPILMSGDPGRRATDRLPLVSNPVYKRFVAKGCRLSGESRTTRGSHLPTLARVVNGYYPPPHAD